MKKVISRYSNHLGARVWVSVFRSWWVLLFITGLYICHKQSMQKKETLKMRLERDLALFSLEKTKLIERQHEFLAQIASQNDPDWIELTLIHKLGVVPEGQTKVYFQKGP